ncbi:hypothetical protein QUF72_11125 [Desulfobacterales bacterium HSG2]|nr:hypothetical protein [Desulfobacterales bacterium HSG2]
MMEMYFYGNNDGHGGTFAKPFTVTVNDLNESPAVSVIADQTADFRNPEAPGSLTATFTVGDPDMSADKLTLSAESSDSVLVPAENIGFAGSDTERTVILNPAEGVSRWTVVTVTVSDGELSAVTSFTLTVILGPVFDGVSVKPVCDPDTPVSSGDMLTYTAVIPNSGDRDAEVLFTLPVPEHTAYVQGSLGIQKVGDSETDPGEETEIPAPEHDDNLNRIEWTGNIPAGDAVEIFFDVAVSEDVQRETVITNDGWRLSHDPDGVSEVIVTQKPDDEENPPVRIEIPEPECLKGDISGDGVVDLPDAIRILQISAGIETDTVQLCADVNGDGRIGIEELIWVLRKVSE